MSSVIEKKKDNEVVVPWGICGPASSGSCAQWPPRKAGQVLQGPWGLAHQRESKRGRSRFRSPELGRQRAQGYMPAWEFFGCPVNAQI